MSFSYQGPAALDTAEGKPAPENVSRVETRISLSQMMPDLWLLSWIDSLPAAKTAQRVRVTLASGWSRAGAVTWVGPSSLVFRDSPA